MSGSSAARGYGYRYRRLRAELLANHPPCHWCGKPATTADHEPPLHVVGHAHLSLVPACERCNYGRRSTGFTTAAPSRDW